MKPLIITDSNCDLSDEYIKENNIIVIPFCFNIKETDYEGNFGLSISCKEFYNELRKGEISTTAQITPYKFEQIFRKYVSQGFSIIYIGFSSALSQTCNNAILARKIILEDNKNADINIIDSRRATAGQGLIIYYTSELLKQEKSKEYIINWIEDNKLKVNLWFTVDNLMHLKRGGRISTTSATLGTLLEIKPILQVDNHGNLIAIKKVRGRKKSIRSLLEEFKARVINPKEKTIFINHADCLKDAEYLKDLIISDFEVKNVIINCVGPVIGTHTGPGMLCIAFIGKSGDI